MRNAINKYKPLPLVQNGSDSHLASGSIEEQDIPDRL
jgi:hypothetical protein